MNDKEKAGRERYELWRIAATAYHYDNVEEMLANVINNPLVPGVCKCGHTELIATDTDWCENCKKFSVISVLAIGTEKCI